MNSSSTSLSFEDWLNAVDRAVGRIGLSYMDLPDCPYADWYEDELSPAQAAKLAIREAF